MSKLAHSNDASMRQIEYDRLVRDGEMNALPTRCCGRCVSWRRNQPDDMTAPEGYCGQPNDPGHWPSGYWPATLQQDGCGKFLDSGTIR